MNKHPEDKTTASKPGNRIFNFWLKSACGLLHGTQQTLMDEKPFMQTITTILIGLFITSSALAAPLTEREELALMLNQLTQIEASLHRAQQSASTGNRERYYFDYPRIHADITTLREGVEHYLSPARAQPRDMTTLAGEYRQEQTIP